MIELYIIEWREFDELSDLLDGWFTGDDDYHTPADPVAWCEIELPEPWRKR